MIDLTWAMPFENGAIALIVAVSAGMILARQAQNQKTLDVIHTTVNSNLAAEVAANVDKERQIGDLKAVIATSVVRETALIAALAAAQQPSQH